jgi:hypothetical protein
MQPSPLADNPFVMLTDPQSILQAVERSERLNRLRRTVCRPLDKPLIPKVSAKDGEPGDLGQFDREIDQAADEAPDSADSGDLA